MFFLAYTFACMFISLSTLTLLPPFSPSLSPLAKDSGFDSFHCFIGGANVCAWGTGNSDEDGNGGSCRFLLAPGATYVGFLLVSCRASF